MHKRALKCNPLHTEYMCVSVSLTPSDIYPLELLETALILLTLTESM